MKSLKIDDDRCTGCSLCELICSLMHFKENNPKKAALRIERRFPAPGAFVIHLCNQCGHCQKVCPTEAIFEKERVYNIDPANCNFCGFYNEECPYGVLYTHRDIPYPIKCDLCGECVSVCAPEAIQWSK